ncbi:uncharacterized protein LOC144119018 [Amblyomma americanum]
MPSLRTEDEEDSVPACHRTEMAEQATQTVDAQRDAEAVSPKLHAKDGESPFFDEGLMQAGEQQQPPPTEELAKMMAKMMNCSPMDVGPDGGPVPGDDFPGMMRGLLAKAEQPIGEDEDALEHVQQLVTDGRGVLEKLAEALNNLIARGMSENTAQL